MPEFDRPRFQAGGALRPDAVYAERAADGELLRALRDGASCHVLASRQSGKTSLRLRVAARLEAEGVCCTAVALSELGGASSSPEEWYAALLSKLADPLRPHVEDGAAQRFWAERRTLPPARRLAAFLRDGVMERVPGNVVVFLDEVEATLSLPFPREDLFAVIRGLHDERPSVPALGRLAFCVLGAATARELTPDPTRAPFSVSHGVALHDLERSELAAFEPGLTGIVAEPRAVLDAVYAHTGGHPYMSQRICADLVGERRGASPSEIAQDRFLLHGRSEDPELAWADRRFHRSDGDPRAAAMLALYQRIHGGAEVDWDPANEIHEALRLTGLVAERYDGVCRWLLQIRNRIVAKTFDAVWFQARQEERLFSGPLHRWLQSGRRHDALLRGDELRRAVQWSRDRDDLTPDERAFLQAGRAQERRRAASWLALRAFAGATLVLAAGAVALYLLYAGASRGQDEAVRAAVGAHEDRLAAIGEAERAETARREAAERADREAAERQKATGAEATAKTNAARAERERNDALARSLAAAALLTDDRSPERRLLLAAAAARQTEANGDRDTPVVQRALRLALREPRGRPIDLGARAVAAMNADGRALVTGGKDGTIRIWRAPYEGGTPAETVAAGGSVTALALAPDGTLAFGLADGSVLRRVPGGAPTRVGAVRGPVRALSVADGGRGVAVVGGDRAASLWRPDGATAALPLAEDATRVAITPNGLWVAVATRRGGTTAWSLAADEPVSVSLRIDRSGGADTVLATSADGAWLATGSSSGTVRVFLLSRLPRVTSAAYTLSRRGRTAAVTSIALAPDVAHVVVADADHEVRLWSMQQRGRFRVDAVHRGHDRSVVATAAIPAAVAAAPEEDAPVPPPTVVTVPESGPARVWEPDGAPHAEDPLVFADHYRRVDAVAVSPDSRWFATGDARGRVRVWPLGPEGAASAAVASYRAHRGQVSGLAFRPDGALVSAGPDRWIYVWPSVAELRALPPTEDGEPGQPEPRLALRVDGPVRALALSADGLRVGAGLRDSPPRVWTLGAGGRTAEALALTAVEGGPAAIGALSFSADGSRVAGGSPADPVVGVWAFDGAAPFALGQRVDGDGVPVRGMAFLPPDLRLAIADDRVRVWDLASPDAAAVTLPGVAHGLGRAFAAHPKGEWLAAGARDGTVVLWDLRGGAASAAVVPLAGHEKAVRAAAFSPDGRWLVTGSADATARAWRIPAEELRALACAAALRDLTEEEWREVAGSAEKTPTCP